MKLTALRLYNIRRFAGEGIAIEGLADGVNVLCATNEHGKSTCFDALHALFFQAHTGAPALVKGLQPYSGGSPLIEADITTGDGAYRLTKQFLSGRRATVRDLASGRLLAQADEAERFIGNLVRDGGAGPAGLLWVRQGVTGLDLRKKSEEEDEKQARENVLSSVQGEVEAITGGRRMVEILVACDEELARLMTSRGPKKDGPYARAIALHDELLAEEQRLEGEVRDLRTALDTRRQLRARLTEIENPAEIAALREDAAAAEKAFDDAKARKGMLDAARAELQLAANTGESARAALDSFRAALSRARELHGLHATAAARQEEAARNRQETSTAELGAREAVEVAEQEEQRARDLLALCERAERAREATAQLGGLREALAAAEAARQAGENHKAAAQALDVPDALLRELEQADTELVRQRAIAAAKSPTVRIDYRDGVAAGITRDGEPLAGGEDHRVAGPLRLDIDGIGALTIVPPVVDGSQLARAEQTRRDLLQRIGVEDIAAARARQAAAHDQKSAARLAHERFRLLAPNGLDTLRADIARLAAISADAPETAEETGAVRLALAAAGQRIGTARLAAQSAQAALKAATQAAFDAERAVDTLAGEIRTLDAQLGPIATRAEREAELMRSFGETDAALTAAKEKVASLEQATDDLANAEAAHRRMQSALKNAETQAQELKRQLAGLDERIRTRSDDAVEEIWQETIEKRTAAGAEVARFAKEVSVLTRLRDTLDAARSEARDHYFEPVMRELRPLMSVLFADASVTFDDATLLPQSLTRNGQDEQVTALSGGMREQLAILTRLAFARLLARDGKAAPVVLDDALVYSDDDRIERMFDALHRIARDQQIIVFSCRQRAFAKLGGHRLQMTDWKPAD